jgi:hypothetical protein
MRNKGSSLAALSVVLLVSIPPLAADTVIQRGIDVFTTTSDGSTHYSFANNPIPAGFFCKSSRPFTGIVAFKGLPLETGTPGQLGDADTVVERLDDAVFDASGTAVTRIRFRALSMVSISPLKTACGAFHVYASLADQQRVTTMRISRTEKYGGVFVAPLAVDMRLSFIPVKPSGNKSARKLELTGSITFPGRAIPWSLTNGPSAKRISSVVVDTNGDLTPDTRLFGTPNFWPGRRPPVGTLVKGDGECRMCEVCHYTGTPDWHCVLVETCPPDYCI